MGGAGREGGVGGSGGGGMFVVTQQNLVESQFINSITNNLR